MFSGSQSLFTRRGVLAIDAAGNQNTYAPSPLAVNASTHLAPTYEDAMARLYINGLQVDSQPQPPL